MFSKILIANRGEIAVRVMRACREMGIATVAVYSDVDRAAMHVQMADEAYGIGAAAASESYLNIAKIIEVALGCGADAIHPGYGFLSENPQFARACKQAGIKFIGPSAESMEMMGSKTQARRRMEAIGVPFVPGTSKGVNDESEAKEVAARIGYPVMLKAAAGGGGKGMRLVAEPSNLAQALLAAKGEAKSAFGNDEVYIEKAILKPRHIEMQILADEAGNCVYLGERECSIQRRHQKVIEEAPSPVVDEAMRKRMGETAVRAAQAANYWNAGTIEFLVDEGRNFYFLEMNTRLQVEHPVTEIVTGLDLVNLQIRIAAGEKLPFGQQDIELRGHAIECRIYAEDPENNYFPSPGKIETFLEPAGPGIRNDGAIYEGWTVPIEYDPLLSKLVGFGATREVATAKLLRGLDEYFVGGIKTNIPLFKAVLNDEGFRRGELDTGFLERLKLAGGDSASPETLKVAAVAAAIQATEKLPQAPESDLRRASEWKRISRAEAVR